MSRNVVIYTLGLLIMVKSIFLYLNREFLISTYISDAEEALLSGNVFVRLGCFLLFWIGLHLVSIRNESQAVLRKTLLNLIILFSLIIVHGLLYSSDGVSKTPIPLIILSFFHLSIALYGYLKKT
jgi:hypothetical protein